MAEFPETSQAVTGNRKPLVLITGSEGLIGSRLRERLSPFYHVVGLDLKAAESRSSDPDFLKCDLTSDQSVANTLNEFRGRFGPSIASVIHLAAYYDFAGEPSPLYDRLTVQGTRRLIEGLQSFEVEQFIFSSSLLVMKPAEGEELLTEDSPTEGSWDYPRSKLEAEEVLRNEHGKVPVLVLRIAGVYDEDGHSVPISQQVSRIYEKKMESYFFPGNSDHGQAFVHLDDLAEGFEKAVEARAQLPDYEVLLIAEPDVMSYSELQEVIGELLYSDAWPTIRIPKVVAKAGAWVQDKLADEDDPTFIKPWMIDLADAHLPVDIERARKQLGWNPRRRLRLTLPTIIERLKQNPQHWYELNGLPVPENLPVVEHV